MAYIPKSRVKKAIAVKGEFELKLTGQPYEGPYIQLSTGLIYVGTDSNNLGDELIKLDKEKEARIPRSRNNLKYSRLKPRKKQVLLKTTIIPITKVKPLPKDYENFKYTRYFAKRINSNYAYFEINKETYMDIKQEKPHYDFRLYEVGKIKWALRGDTSKINTFTLSLVEKKHPGLSILFQNLNEFRSPDPLPLSESSYYKAKTPDTISNELIEAEKFTIAALSLPKDPLQLINQHNFTKHNIEGRKDFDGSSIDNNLPPSYGLPKGDPKVIAEEQHCCNCVYYEGNGRKCIFWEAKVKQQHWCESYQPYDPEVYEEARLIKFDENVFFNPDEEPGDMQTNVSTSDDVLTSYTSKGSNNSSGGGGGGY
jgi:hypothetical protein